MLYILLPSLSLDLHRVGKTCKVIIELFDRRDVPRIILWQSMCAFRL